MKGVDHMDQMVQNVDYGSVSNSNGKHDMALMSADHTASKFVSESANSVLISKRQERLTNDHKSFRIADIIIFLNGSVMED